MSSWKALAVMAMMGSEASRRSGSGPGRQEKRRRLWRSSSSGISRAAAKTAATYTKDGTWSSTLNSVVGNRIRKAAGQSDKTEDSEKTGKSDKTTTNTDKVDDEIRQLKNRKEKLEAQIRKEYSPERRREYEKELKEIEKELSVKDTDYYRRQNATVS